MMKHIEPPENLPVVPDPTEAEVTTMDAEDVHFRDRGAGDIVAPTQSTDAPRASRTPAPRSLQPVNNDMTQKQERPIRAPDDLLSVDDVRERLLLSRAAVYRLIARRQLPHYRLPGGLRFKAADVDAFLDSRRTEVRPSKKYGAQDQGKLVG